MTRPLVAEAVGTFAYIVAPPAGAALGGLAYQFVRGEPAAAATEVA